MVSMPRQSAGRGCSTKFSAGQRAPAGDRRLRRLAGGEEAVADDARGRAAGDGRSPAGAAR